VVENVQNSPGGGRNGGRRRGKFAEAMVL